MKDYRDVEVLRAAIHVVAPRDGRLVLTAAELDLGDGVGHFLAEHVARGIHDSRAAAATFVSREPARAGGLTDSMLEGGTDLLTGSSGLAQLLYDAAVDDARVPDGTLAVAECEAEGGHRFVAMLKLDPSDQYSAVEDEDEDGNPVVRLVVRDDVLPSVRERIQKAVFVRGPGHEYDALIVDRQRKGQEVSTYFVRDFLQAETVLDDAARTKKFYQALNHARQQVADRLDEHQLDRLTRYIDGAVVGGRVIVDDVVDGLPVPEELREPFREHLNRVLPDREFELDEATVDELMRRPVYEGDYQLRVSHLGDAPGDLLEETPPTGEDDRWTITIHTRKWRRK